MMIGRSRVALLTCSFGWLLNAAVPSAQHGLPVTVNDAARGAERVVIGQVTRADAVQQTNSYGDVLIVSHTIVRVDETLKGASGSAVVIEIEGGTLNGITMRASDMPTLQVGDRAVLFVDHTASGRFVPHLRGHGILKVNANGSVENGSLSLEEIRSAVRAAGR
jgi:hypothetical protein